MTQEEIFNTYQDYISKFFMREFGGSYATANTTIDWRFTEYDEKRYNQVIFETVIFIKNTCSEKQLKSFKFMNSLVEKISGHIAIYLAKDRTMDTKELIPELVKIHSYLNPRLVPQPRTQAQQKTPVNVLCLHNSSTR